MGIIRFAIQNPVKVAVAVILLVLFGTLSIFQIPIQLTPDVDRPLISVETFWEGASPQEVEREIVAALERDSVISQEAFESLFCTLLCVETNALWRWIRHGEQIPSDAQVVFGPNQPLLGQFTYRVAHIAPFLRERLCG